MSKDKLIVGATYELVDSPILNLNNESYEAHEIGIFTVVSFNDDTYKTYAPSIDQFSYTDLPSELINKSTCKKREFDLANELKEIILTTCKLSEESKKVNSHLREHDIRQGTNTTLLYGFIGGLRNLAGKGLLPVELAIKPSEVYLGQKIINS